MINKLKKHIPFFIFLFLGLSIFTYPMIISNFDLMPGNGHDVKSFGYILEHIRLWVFQEYPHQSLWDPPFYYPTKNTLAFSDTLFGIAPFYIILRLFFSPFSAIQALVVVLCILNFSTFYYLLNKQLKFSPLASALGSFIFSFGLSRYFRYCHLNYFAQFYSILFIIFLLKINKTNSGKLNNIYFALSSFFLVVQFYTCYSFAYYLGLVGFIGIIAGLFFKETQKHIFSFVNNFYKQILLYGFLAFLALLPLAYHYITVGTLRSIDSILTYIQPPLAWLRSLSIFDDFLLNTFRITVPYIDEVTAEEFACSIGLIATMIAIVGIFLSKKYKWITLILLIFIFLSSCEINGFIFWKAFYYTIPGAQGMRSLIRISYISLIIFSISIAFYIDFIKAKSQKIGFKILLILSILLITIEQIPYLKDVNSAWRTFIWSKKEFVKEIQEVVKKVPKDAKYLFIETYIVDYEHLLPERYGIASSSESILSNALAIWCANELKIYSVNGLSGMSSDEVPEDTENLYTITLKKSLKGF